MTLSPDITEESIRALVDGFYGKIRNDQALAPIFTEAIGTDPDAWKPHLEIMYAFWSSLMLSTRRYGGNPFQKHKNLPPFDAALFDRWLKLFAETAHEVHPPEIAGRFVEKSQMVAQSLKYGLYGRS